MTTNILELKGVEKRFGAVLALGGLDLKIPSRGVFALLGPNGAGKTTALRIVCGLIPADAGTVLFNGEELKKMAGLRQSIGVCPQELIIWEYLTAHEQLVLVARLHGLDNRSAQKRSDHFLDRLGLTAHARRRAGSLSGGMKRKLNILLALIHDPMLILLDEPEAGLDAHSRVQVRHFITELAKEKAVLLTSHNLDEVDRLADRVAIIDGGKVLAQGTPAELKASMGEGQVLQIRLLGQDHIDIKACLDDLRQRPEVEALHWLDPLLWIRSHQAPALLTNGLPLIEHYGLKAVEIAIRESSLEDLFIRLTGRRIGYDDRLDIAG